MSECIEIYPKEEIIKFCSKCLGGVRVWGCDNNNVLYAQCSAKEFVPVTHVVSEGRVELFVSDCEIVMAYGIQV